eukprot:PITA_31513
MEEFFDCEETKEGKKATFVVTKLEGHAPLWSVRVHVERRILGKEPIRNLNKMVEKMKNEFYKVSIRGGKIRDIDEKVARYVNGIGMDIEDEISVLSPKIVEEAYQMVLKAEEKLMRKKSARNTSTFQGRGGQGGRGRSTTPRDGSSRNSIEHAPTRGDASDRRIFSRGRGGRCRGREVRCYRCNKLGHRDYECPKNIGTNQRNAIIAKTKEEETKVIDKENVPEKGESLVVNKILFKLSKEIVEQEQRKTLFMTVCKVQEKCCQMIIDNGSKDNFLSI